MIDSATGILEKICCQVFKECGLAYYILDGLGKIIQWGGNLSDLRLGIPEKNSPISDSVVFMEGILPLKTSSMEFSCIKMPSTGPVDALLFRLDPGYGLILWDASKKEAYLTQEQQIRNESILLQQEQKKTEQIHSEEKICQEKTQTLLEDLFQALNLIVLEMNSQGQFSLVGTPPDWIDQIPQANLLISGQVYEEDVFSFLGNFMGEARTRWSRNHPSAFKSGIWIQKDPQGQEVLFEATGVDVHGRKLMILSQDVCYPHEKQSIIQKGRNLALNYHSLKRSGREMKKLQDELELRVQERTQALTEANRCLAAELEERKILEKERKEMSRQLRQSQKMEAIGTLAGGIAHDFNNILSGIMGFTELSLAQAPSGSPLTPNLEKILSAALRAKDLVRQILTFSHQTEYQKKPLKLGRLVTEVLNLLKASLPASITIVQELQTDGCILADQTQMHQVLLNLCTNAAQAMEDRGGTLGVGLKEIDMDSKGLDAEIISSRQVVLTVRDTGSGIGPEVLERIFDPYYTTKEKGTGLGLSVVHGIVTKTNGCITVKSQVGQGSVFNIHFPALDAPQRADSLPESVPLGNNERILLVDDETIQTEMAEKLLGRLGYQVVPINDSMEALAIFSADRENFDLVITDMIMPRMTGKTLAEKIFEIKPEIPIILCSGYSHEMKSGVMEQAGITLNLMKPFTMKDLAKAVKTALAKTERHPRPI